MELHSIETFEFNEDEKPYNIRHRCYYFSKEIILFVKDCKYGKIYSSLFDQLIRSATSIGAIWLKALQEAQKRIGKSFT